MVFSVSSYLNVTINVILCNLRVCYLQNTQLLSNRRLYTPIAKFYANCDLVYGPEMLEKNLQ